MENFVERGIAGRLREALADTPVVIVQGPRQCGKSTLVQRVCDLPYVTLDDTFTLSNALASPEGWLKSFKEGAIIDEIQRAPQLMRSVKAVVDADRRPGRFVLTGSANVLLLPKLSDSLAGRMEVLTLYPFSQSELSGQPKPFLDRWTAGELKGGMESNVAWGGFPEPLKRNSDSRKRAWFQAYIRALMDRDVRDLAQIEGLNALPNLLQVLANAPYEVQNVTQISRDTGIPATSLSRYISLLQAVYLIHPVPAWSALQNGKAAKTARLAFSDLGVWNFFQPRTHDENCTAMYVAMELVKEAGWAEEPYEVMHFRSTRHHSVPIVLGLPNGQIYGINVVNRELINDGDFAGLRFLRDVAGDAFVAGIVLSRHREVGYLDEQLSYAPKSSLWAV